MDDLQSLLEQVRRGFEGDAWEAAAAFHDDATFRDNADQDVLRGADDIRDHFGAYGGRRERAEVSSLLDDGRRAAVAFTVRFRADADAYAQRGLAIVELRDGRIASWRGVWIETPETLDAWGGD